ncbi:interleukin-3 receptor subunit alpha-like isoform X2 [Antechinus flavipes]|uniref:interleukin-3 receptor subunit alpha-like isoform X2 n=1 Tax=Antechinus flavipes TaxID=38775 RepID=UPI002236194B|nr:interleukin-3 receptor subunit alpha-like isoform X2 [Antechinus flavipes]
MPNTKQSSDPVLTSVFMANLIFFIWFSMLLSLTYSQTQKQEVTPAQGATSHWFALLIEDEASVASADFQNFKKGTRAQPEVLPYATLQTSPDSPIKNITIDHVVDTMWLNWINVENVNNINCTIKVLSKVVYKTEAKNNSRCEIKSFHSWCQGVDFVIEGFAGKRFSKTVHLPQRGEEGTTKENVSCEIHKANFMDCKWTVRKTPGDIHYQFFYSQSPMTFVDRECPNYKTDFEGRRVGCHFDNLSGFPNPYPYHFLVIGTHNGREVQCTDDNISLWDIEIFKPPNVTIDCKDLNCSLQWQAPKTIFQGDEENFDYQLQIQKIADKNMSPVVLKVSKTTRYDYKINYGKYTVKIRTKKIFHENWSTWSEPQEFGQEVHEDNLLPVLMVLLPGITFIIVLIVGYLCKRYYVIQKIFPPIPQIRDQVSDSFQKYVEVDWEENKILPEQCKIEEIQVT